MKPRFNRSDERGFSFIELLTAIVLLGILIGLALPNYRSFRQQSRDTAAFSDFRNLKTAVLGDIQDPDSLLNYFAFGVEGPASLPGEFEHATLSDGVRLNYLFVLTVVTPLTETSWALFEVNHEQGSKRYRYWNINGVITEQVIDL